MKTATAKTESTIRYYERRGWGLERQSESALLFTRHADGDPHVMATNTKGIEYGMTKMSGIAGRAALSAVVDAMWQDMNR